MQTLKLNGLFKMNYCRWHWGNHKDGFCMARQWPYQRNLDFFSCNSRYQIYLIATNHRQRELVALTIRGSVLFYSSAIWTSDFRSVKREIRYLYGVDLDRSKTWFYRWKMYIDHFWQWKNTKNKLESQRYRFCWYSSYILTTRLFTNRKTP